MKKLFLSLTLLLLSNLALGQGQASGSVSATGVIAGSNINTFITGANVFKLTVNTTGTPATLAIQIEGSVNNGTSYSVCGASQTTTTLFTYYCSGTYDHVQVNLTGLTGGSSPTVSYSLTAWVVGDPCLDKRIPKTKVAVAISTATTTELVASSPGRVVHVCGFDTTVGGTSPTLIFKTGTKVTTPCDTTPSSISGTYTPLVGNEINIPNLDAMVSISGGEICITSGGTPSIQGTMQVVIL